MSLTPKRIAQYRECISAELPDWVPVHKSDLLALLDAYEAQRPRGAGEVPAPGAEVLVKTRAGGARSVGFHDGSGDEPMWHTEDGTWSTDDIERWWPLPKGGEA